MKIFLNTEMCKKHSINIEQAALLSILMNPQNGGRDEVIKCSSLSSLQILEVEELFKKINEGGKNKNKRDEYFEEFWEAYPFKTLRPDGSIGYLRQGILKNKARIIYKKNVKKGEEDKVLSFMIKDIAGRDEEQKKWLKTIPRYLEEKPWEDDIEQNISSFGTKIV